MLNALVWLLSLLPLSTARKLGQSGGALIWLFQTRMAQITEENLELCMTELSSAERKQLARRSLQETCKLVIEVAKVWQKSPEWSIRQFVSEEGKAMLDNALASGKPTIVLVPHLGNWEVLGPYLAKQKAITILYLPPTNPAHDAFIIKSREKAGIQLAPANRKGVMSLLKAAEAGGFIGILPDQEPDLSGGEFAPFFHQPALTMVLVHKLIQRHDCMVLMSYAERVPHGFKAVFSEPNPDIYSKDTATSLSGLNKSIEACIRKIPEQYQWEYKRFKQHPSGKKKVHYRKHK